MKKVTFWIIGITLFWMGLTLWVNMSSDQPVITIGDNTEKKVMIFFNPDPISDMDEQVCKAIAESLSVNATVEIITPSQIPHAVASSYDLHIFCSNTYNLEPDKGVIKAIKALDIENKDVVAITLGAGSTEASEKKLIKLLNSKQANLLHSKTYWLLKPNDENRQDEDNVEVAVEMAQAFGKELAK